MLSRGSLWIVGGHCSLRSRRGHERWRAGGNQCDICWLGTWQHGRHGYYFCGDRYSPAAIVGRSDAVEAAWGHNVVSLVAIERFLTWWVSQSTTTHGGMVTKRALEQWHLLEATAARLRGRTMVYHHVLCKSSLHARQHFDEVLLQSSWHF